MRLVLVNLYPEDTLANYLLSSYYLKAYLQRHWDQAEPLEVRVLDFMAGRTDPGRIAAAVMEAGPDMVGYSCYVWNIEKIMDVAARVAGGGAAGQVLGGPEISLRRAAELDRRQEGLFYVLG